MYVNIEGTDIFPDWQPGNTADKMIKTTIFTTANLT